MTQMPEPVPPTKCTPATATPQKYNSIVMHLILGQSWFCRLKYGQVNQVDDSSKSACGVVIAAGALGYRSQYLKEPILVIAMPRNPNDTITADPRSLVTL